MKIETQPRDDHQVTLTIELESERMERARRKAARKLSKRVKIPGFRPGKAPYDVLRLHIGDEAIIEEAIDALLDEVYPEALKEADLKPGAPGKLEEVLSIDPPKFVFTVPLAPSVDLGNYHEVRLPYEWTPPTEEDVNAALEELRQQYGVTQPVERPVEEGDFVLLEVVGKKTKAAEGEDPIVFKNENYAVVVRSKKQADESPYPGFSKKLIGMSAGEEKTFSHKFPEDAEDESLRGATVKYTVKIKAVHSMELPELNDEFAKTVGAGDTLDELREIIRKDLEAHSKDEYDKTYFDEALAKIREGATILYPPQMLEEEIDSMVEELKKQLSQYGLELDTYLKMLETDYETFVEEKIKPEAKERLEDRLVMDTIVEEEEIEISEGDLQQEFSRRLLSMQDSGLDLNQLRGERNQKRFAELLVHDSAGYLLVQGALERIKAIATGEWEKMKAEAEAKAAEAEAEKAEEKSPEAEEESEDAAEKESAPTEESDE